MKKRALRVHKEEEIPELLRRQWIQPKVNIGSKQHNFNCELCTKPTSISSTVLHCIYCNVVAHSACFHQHYPRIRITKPKMWICFYCMDDLDDSRLHYETEHQEIIEHELRTNAQITIAKHWRRYIARCFYIRVYTVIVKLQIMFHVRHRKRDFLMNLQEKLRPMKVKIIKCNEIMVIDRDFTNKTNTSSNHATSPNHHNSSPSHHTVTAAQSLVSAPLGTVLLKKKEYTFYVIVTIIDINDANGFINQLWRANSNHYYTTYQPNQSFELKMDEKIVLGGVSGFHTMVVTLFQKGTGRDYLVGQVSIDLSSNYIWRKGGKFTLALQPANYLIKDYGGMEMKADSRIPPPREASIELEIFTYHGMNSECGICHGTSLEDFLRSLNRLPNFNGYQIPSRNHLRNGRGGGGAAAGGGAASGGGSSSGGGGASGGGGGSVTFAISYTFSMKKMWIAIVEGFVYLYAHFGDQLKLAIDLSYFSPGYEYLDKSVIFKIMKGGYPNYLFRCHSVGETLRWKCAFISSLKCNTNSITGGGTGGGGGRGVTFDVRTLIEDLMAVEMKLVTKKGYKGEMLPILGSHKKNKEPGSSPVAGDHGKGSKAAKPAKGKGLRASTKSLTSLTNQLTNQMKNSNNNISNNSNNRPTLPPLSLTNANGGSNGKTLHSTLNSKLKEFFPDELEQQQAAQQQQQQQIQQARNERRHSMVSQQLLQAIGQKIQEQYDLDDIVVNEKYKHFGEVFVASMMETAAEQKIQHHRGHIHMEEF